MTTFVSEKMNIEDLQDILAMISFELIVNENKSNKGIIENNDAQKKNK